MKARSSVETRRKGVCVDLNIIGKAILRLVQSLTPSSPKHKGSITSRQELLMLFKH